MGTTAGERDPRGKKALFESVFIEMTSGAQREGPGEVTAPCPHFLRGILSGRSWKKSLHIMAMQARKVTYSWKSTSLSLLQSRLLMSFCKLASLVCFCRKKIKKKKKECVGGV